jgi:hypothetical protein
MQIEWILVEGLFWCFLNFAFLFFGLYFVKIQVIFVCFSCSLQFNGKMQPKGHVD